MTTKKYKFCQSCAMPLKHDPQGGGTEVDGTKSSMYCSYCYKNGKFTDDFKIAKEMQEFCKKKLVEMRFPRIVAWLFTHGIPKLERWKASRKEIAEMLISTGKTVIGDKTITIKGYPFEPSIAYRYRAFDASEIVNIDPDSFPPTIQVENELIPIPATQKEALSQFAANNVISTVHRPDIWGWILEPFLDTELTEDMDKRLHGLLAEYGLGEQEVRSLRQEVETQMIKYNFDTMLWEWVSLDLTDVLKAMRAKYDKEQFEAFFRKAMAIALSEKLYQ